MGLVEPVRIGLLATALRRRKRGDEPLDHAPLVVGTGAAERRKWRQLGDRSSVDVGCGCSLVVVVCLRRRWSQLEREINFGVLALAVPARERKPRRVRIELLREVDDAAGENTKRRVAAMQDGGRASRQIPNAYALANASELRAGAVHIEPQVLARDAGKPLVVCDAAPCRVRHLACEGQGQVPVNISAGSSGRNACRTSWASVLEGMAAWSSTAARAIARAPSSCGSERPSRRSTSSQRHHYLKWPSSAPSQDPRWLVAERKDGTNVNGWHWQMSDMTEITKAALKVSLEAPTLLSNTSSKLRHCALTKVAVRGDCSVTTRKGKRFLICELDVQMVWTGELKEDNNDHPAESASGSIHLPDVSPETLDDLEATFTTDSRGSPLSELMRKEGVAAIKRAVCSCMRTLEAKMAEMAEPPPQQPQPPPQQQPQPVSMSDDATNKDAAGWETIHDPGKLPPPPTAAAAAAAVAAAQQRSAA